MAQPNIKELITAVPLVNASIQYKNSAYIADRVFPMLDNIDPKAKITRFLKGAWFRDEADVRGAGANAKRGGYPIDTLSLDTTEYAYAKEVTDEDKRLANAAGGVAVTPAIDAIEFCSDKLDLKREILVADLIITGTWSGVAGEDAAGLWAAGGSNTFLADVNARIETIRAATGLKPNVLMIDFGTFNSLKEEATVLDKIKYTQLGVLTQDLMASMLGLDEILLGEAIKNTAEEILAGTGWTSANIWEKTATKGSAFLFYRPPRIALKTPSAGVTARARQDTGSPRRLTTWREASRHQDVYEAAEELDVIITGADLGFLWYDTLLT